MWGGDILALALAVGIVGVIVYGYKTKPGWFGVADKKFWDYLELLIVPVALAIGVYLLNRAQRQRKLEAETVQEATRYLADRGIRTVGVDYLSVGGFRKDGVETHRALLEAEIWVIEGLDLSEVEPGEYELICLPVKIERSDGAPARAILRAI